VTIDFDMGVAVLRRRPNQHRLPMELETRLLLPNNGSAIDAFTFQEFDVLRDELIRLVSLREFREWLDEEVEAGATGGN